MIQATQMRPGMCVIHQGNIVVVMSMIHKTPGNLRGFVQARMRNLKTGNSFEHRFSSTESVERAILDTHPMEYLYSDPTGHHFMNQENYEQITMANDILGDALQYLLPNMVLKVDFYDGTPVGIELPNTVTLTVADTEPGMKNATASSSGKPAKMETGLVVTVPQFVNTGDRLVIDTRENKYLSRA